MLPQQITTADYLDILFEEKNKLYGAYPLRKRYELRLLTAVTVSLVTAFGLLLFFRPSFSQSSGIADKGEIIIREFKLPEPAVKKPEPPKPPQTAKPQVRQQNFTDQIQLKKEVTDPLPPLDAMEKAEISNVTTPGAEATAMQAPAVSETKVPEAKSPVAEPKEEVAPDKQPQFPGGMQAWLSFLSRNLHAPEELESGEKRTVVIRFHVAEDGSVTRFQVEKSAGTAFDEEVIRVLKKMPKWAPALKAGQPVSVSFTQPVTFVGLEE